MYKFHAGQFYQFTLRFVHLFILSERVLTSLEYNDQQCAGFTMEPSTYLLTGSWQCTGSRSTNLWSLTGPVCQKESTVVEAWTLQWIHFLLGTQLYNIQYSRFTIGKHSRFTIERYSRSTISRYSRFTIGRYWRFTTGRYSRFTIMRYSRFTIGRCSRYTSYKRRSSTIQQFTVVLCSIRIDKHYRCSMVQL